MGGPAPLTAAGGVSGLCIEVSVTPHEPLIVRERQRALRRPLLPLLGMYVALAQIGASHFVGMLFYLLNTCRPFFGR